MLVLGGCNLYNIAKVFEYSCVNIQGFCSLGIYGYDESCETCKIGAFAENE